jgi:hypothetical protein
MSNPSGKCHVFDTGYAMAYGVNEAIMIHNLQFFITANANRGVNFRDGRFWTYDKLIDFPKHFPYWSVDQVRTIIKSLVKQEVIIVGNFNKEWSNRTCWYAFVNQDKFIFTDTPEPAHAKKEPPHSISADLGNSPNDIWENYQMTNGEIPKCIYDTSYIASSIPSSIPPTPSPSAARAAASAGADGVCMSSSSSKSKAKKAKEFPEEVQQVAAKLIGVMQQHNKTFRSPPPDQPVFQEAAQLLLEQEQDIDYILRVLDWACRDKVKSADDKWRGWSHNIYSRPSSKRKEYGITKFCTCWLSQIEETMKARYDCKLNPGADLSSCDESTAACNARAL